MSSTLTVRLSDTESQSLDTLCASVGKSRSELVREALRSYRRAKRCAKAKPNWRHWRGHRVG